MSAPRPFEPGPSIDEASRGEGDVNVSHRRAAWQARHLDPQTMRWLRCDEAAFLRQSLSTPCLNVLAGARGSRIIDLAGREFLDFHGNSVHQAGFAHPRIVRAIKDQLDELSFCPRRYTCRPAVLLAEKLATLAPEPLGKVLLAPGGTTAVGMALKLARLVTGRHKTVSMWDSFHGAGLDTVSVGGEALFRSGIGPLLPGTEHVPPADPENCVFDDAGDCARCGLKCARYLSYVLEKEGDVAAVVAEPVRATAVNPPPEGYWRAVREACDRHGVLLILDETAVGMARTGRFFAFERYGIVPDMVTLGKGLGGGIIPLAALIARRDLDVGSHVALGHYTHEKNPVGCAAGLATIAIIEEERLAERAEAMGAHALARLEDICVRRPFLSRPRGVGLALAVSADCPDRADAILYGCLSRGLSFKTSHGTTLTLTPPLNIDKADLDRALDMLDAAAGDAA